MGASILLGGFSTFLGTLPLAFTTSNIFQIVFVTFFALVALGVSHGLFCLPMVLSIMGPKTQDNTLQKGTNNDIDNLEQPKQLLEMELKLSTTDRGESRVGGQKLSLFERQCRTQAVAANGLQQCIGWFFYYKSSSRGSHPKVVDWNFGLITHMNWNWLKMCADWVLSCARCTILYDNGHTRIYSYHLLIEKFDLLLNFASSKCTRIYNELVLHSLQAAALLD